MWKIVVKSGEKGGQFDNVLICQCDNATTGEKCKVERGGGCWVAGLQANWRLFDLVG